MICISQRLFIPVKLCYNFRMQTERIITIVVLVVAVVALGFVISRVDKPSGEIINHLIQGPRDNLDGQEALQIEPLPGDEDLIINDIVEGSGPGAKVGDTLLVHYEGTLEDGTKFDSSYDRGEPFEVTVGVSQVIRGWHLGLIGLKVGGKRELVIPPHLGYGESSNDPIPPNSTLYFTVELVSNQRAADEELINLGQ